MRPAALLVHCNSVGSCSASSATDQRSFFSSVAVIVQFWNCAHGAALDEEDLPGDVAVLHRETRDERRDVGGVPRVKDRRVRRGDDVVGQSGRRLGHARARRGRDRVRAHAVATELFGDDHRERGDAGLGGAVVRLADVAEQSRGRRRVDDRRLDGVPGLGLLAPVVGGVARRHEVALQVDVDDRVPVLFAQVHQHAVAQDAGVVHQHVEGAEGRPARTGR